MRTRRSQIALAVGLGLAALALLAGRTVAADERAMVAQPAVNFSVPYTRLLGSAQIKPPVLFADDTDAVAAKMEATTWANSGAAGGFPLYRGFGGWSGPWAGYGAYGYFGAPFAGYWSGWYRPYGYLNFSPFAYGFGNTYGSIYDFQPGGAAPNNISAYRPPFLGTTVFAYPPYGMGNFGGGLYW